MKSPDHSGDFLYRNFCVFFLLLTVAEHKKYKLDKTAFQAMSVEEADNYMRDYKQYNWKERLRISFYLTSLAYGFDISNPPKMDKTIFQKATHS